MCRMVRISRDAVPSSIDIEFERDASVRATEVLIVNHKRNGDEGQAVKLICHDNGDITAGRAQDLTAGVDVIL